MLMVIYVIAQCDETRITVPQQLTIIVPIPGGTSALNRKIGRGPGAISVCLSLHSGNIIVLKLKQRSDGLLHHMMELSLWLKGKAWRKRVRAGDTDAMTETWDFCAVCSVSLNFTIGRPSFTKNRSHRLVRRRRETRGELSARQKDFSTLQK